MSAIPDIACLDGELMGVSQARLPVADEGLLRGDGVFEVLRLYGGAPFARAQHLGRLATSARNLRLPIDLDALAGDLDALLAAAGGADALVRIVATRGGHRIVLLEPLPDQPASLTLGFVTFAPTRVLDGVKSLSYAANMLASRLAREGGFDEALLVSPHGRVLELPTASFFWVQEGRVRTPPLSDHILDSITRREVIEITAATETATTREDLDRAEQAFVASTVLEVVPVSRIEQHELSTAGPTVARCAGELRARITAKLSVPEGGDAS